MAKELIAQIEADEIEGDACLQESIGAVLISCGENEGDVRRGLAYCNMALESARNAGIEGHVESFHDLHERGAFRRILTLTAE